MSTFSITPSCGTCRVCEISAFHNLDEDSLNALTLAKSDRILKKGQLIFNESNHPDGIYAIYNGKVKLFIQGTTGKEQIIQLAGPGAILGYRAILCEQNYHVSAETLEETILCYIPKDIFLDLLNKNMKLSQTVMEMLSKDLGKAQRKVVDINQKTVHERVSEALLNLKLFYGEDPETGFIKEEISRTNLSNMAGTTLESTVRVLNSLKKDKLIQAQGKKIKLLDICALNDCAGVLI